MSVAHTSRPLTTVTSEQWMIDHYWECAEVSISVAGPLGQITLGAVGTKRKIMFLIVRHVGTNNTIVSIVEATSGVVKCTVDVPASTTRAFSLDVQFSSGQIPAVRSSDLTGGKTYVFTSGVEA